VCNVSYPPADSPERSAYHEAGHSVAYCVLGLGVASVTIEVDRANRTAGRTVPSVDAAGGDEDLAIASLAGPFATRRWAPSRTDWQVGADSDLRSADDRIDAIAAAARLPLHAHAIYRARITARVLVELPADFVVRNFDISAAGSEIVFDRLQVNSDIALIERTR
jgi:hypothetical protein